MRALVVVSCWFAVVLAAGLFVALLMTWTLAAGLLCSHALAVALGLWLRDARRKALAFVADFLGEEVEAVHGADLDADVARERARRLPQRESPDDDPWSMARMVGMVEPDALAFAASVGREHAAVRPPAMTGVRDVEAQDRELVDIYSLLDRNEGEPALQRWADAVTGTPSQCQNCKLAPRWVWQQDGVPMGACDLCVELWWPDGIDLLVVRDLAPVVSD